MSITKPFKNYRIFLCIAALVLYIGVVMCNATEESGKDEKRYIGIERAPETIAEYIVLGGIRCLNLLNTLVESFFSYKIISDSLVQGALIKFMVLLKIVYSIYIIFGFAKNGADEYKWFKKDLDILANKDVEKRKEKHTPDQYILYSSEYSEEKSIEFNVLASKSAAIESDEIQVTKTSPILGYITDKFLTAKTMNMFISFVIRVIYIITLLKTVAFLAIFGAVFTNYITNSSISNFLIANSPMSCSIINTIILSLEVLASRYSIILMGCLGVISQSSAVYYNAFCTKDNGKRITNIRAANAYIIKNILTKIIVIVLAITLNLNALLVFIEAGCCYIFSNDFLKIMVNIIEPKTESIPRKKEKHSMPKTPKLNLDQEIALCKFANIICILVTLLFLVYTIWNGVEIATNHPLLLQTTDQILL